MSEHTAENDACGATHEAIDNGAPCKYLAGHLVAGIPHTTANGFWWADSTRVTPPGVDQ